MANYLTTDTELTSVANAIRTKGGTSASLSYPSGFVSAIENIPTGGGSVDEDADVLFIDYDGTSVASKTKTEINAMTSDSDLPANPTHTGLTAQGWNWTVAQLKAHLLAEPDQQVIVGQMYETTSGATEIDIVSTEGRLSPILTLSVSGSVTVDWGDGTTPDTVTGSSLSTRLGPQHIYATHGEYTIKIKETDSGTSYRLYTGSQYPLLRKYTTQTSSDYVEARAYANQIKSVRTGKKLTRLTDYAFGYCYSLETVTLHNEITQIGADCFYYCNNIKSIVIPKSVTTFGNALAQYAIKLQIVSLPCIDFQVSNAFDQCYNLERYTVPYLTTIVKGSTFSTCYSLKKMTLSKETTEIGTYAFQACRTISKIEIPNKVTEIKNYAFKECQSATKTTIPASVTTIGKGAFSVCRGMKEYHFQRSDSVPSLETIVFDSIPSDCIIYVPYSADHSVLEAYKTASNWVEYASYIQEEPQ